MRVPLSKLHRAFPEFDPFPDSECERYVRSAYQRARLRIGCIPLLAFAVALPLYAVALGALVAGLVRAGIERPFEYLIVPVLLGGSVVGVPAVVALVSRDMVLRRVLKDRLRTARCPSCRFSLLGLPVVEGATRCPECGTHIVLSVHHLTARDLEIRREVQGARGEGSAAPGS